MILESMMPAWKERQYVNCCWLTVTGKTVTRKCWSKSNDNQKSKKNNGEVTCSDNKSVVSSKISMATIGS